MGSTVLTGKRASAFQKADGEWIYALFERTYESNCYPHHDKWSAIALGNYASVMRRVFLHAESCEGGMLQSRAGWILPENYIESWRREISKPTRIHDRQIALRAGHTFSVDTLKERAPGLSQRLREVASADQVSALSAGELQVSLYADIDLLTVLCGDRGLFSVWQIISVNDCGTVAMDAPVPRLLPSTVTMAHMPPVRCLALDPENRLIAIGAEPWHHAGWQYNAVGSFIREIAYQLEMRFPGFAKRAIPFFRDLVRAADDVPRETKITITRQYEGLSKWKVESADALAHALGIVTNDQPAPDVFSFCLGDVTGAANDNVLRQLGNLATTQVVWDVPVCPSITAARQIQAAGAGQAAEAGQAAGAGRAIQVADQLCLIL